MLLTDVLFGNLLFQVIALIAAIWVIVDVWTKLKSRTAEKVLWTIAAVFFHVLTAIIYYLVKKKR